MFLHLNIRSVNNFFEQLSLLLDNIKCDTFVIGLTETWFTDEPHTMYSLSIKHNLIFDNRVNRRGGGVAMYISSYTPALYCTNWIKHDESYVGISVYWNHTSEKEKNLVICTIYRPPSYDHNTFLLEIQHLLWSPILQNKHCLLMGDFNVDLLKCNEDNFA